MTKQELIDELVAEVELMEQNLFSQLQQLSRLKIKIAKINDLSEEKITKSVLTKVVESNITQQTPLLESDGAIKEKIEPSDIEEKQDEKEVVKEPLVEETLVVEDKKSEPITNELARKFWDVSVKRNETEPLSNVLLEQKNRSLNDIIEKKQLSDFRKAFSLNDRFRFKRDLFNGDESEMARVIDELNQFCTYEDSLGYIKEKLHWNTENETVNDFVLLLEKRFL